MSITKINNIKISYDINGEGKPLILIAGLGMNQMIWIHQISDFKKFFKVITFDNRGIGKSTSSIGPYSIKMMADDTVELLNHLNIEKSHILGFSMGGAIAQEISINYPKIVEKLILCSTFPKLQNLVDIINRMIIDIFDENVIDIFSLNPRELIFENLFEIFLKIIFNENFVKENRNIIEDTFRKSLFKKKYGETLLKDIRAILKHDTIDRLKLINAETLIMTGKKDKLVPHEYSDILLNKIPNSKIKKIENVGHGLPFEIPFMFNGIVIDFLLKK